LEHAKKKEDDQDGLAERSGQEASPSNHEEGATDQAAKEREGLNFFSVSGEFMEIMLKNQSDILEQLRSMAGSMKALVEWAEWDANHRAKVPTEELIHSSS
jgi:hypothetical protein